MTGPVDTDDIVQGALKWLESFPDVLAVLGADTHGPYLWQHKLWKVIEGTSSTAAVLANAGGWAGPNPHNTLRFPRLSLEIYTDPQRDAGHNVINPGEAERRIEAAYRTIDAHLHRPQSGTQQWGSVRTIACTRLVEPLTYPVVDGDGLLRLQVFYAITQG